MCEVGVISLTDFVQSSFFLPEKVSMVVTNDKNICFNSAQQYGWAFCPGRGVKGHFIYIIRIFTIVETQKTGTNSSINS